MVYKGIGTESGLREGVRDSAGRSLSLNLQRDWVSEVR